MTQYYISDNAKLAAELGVELSSDDECNLVLTGGRRSVTIRRIILYQVDDRRWLDPDAALTAALSLFAADKEPIQGPQS